MSVTANENGAVDLLVGRPTFLERKSQYQILLEQATEMRVVCQFYPLLFQDCGHILK